MKEVIYKSYEELPLFISAEVLANLLGISSSSCYELMHEEDFPTIHIGKRINSILYGRAKYSFKVFISVPLAFALIINSSAYGVNGF